MSTAPNEEAVLTEAVSKYQLSNPTVEGPLIGRSNSVYILVQPQDQSLVVRIPKASSPDTEQQNQGMQILKYLKDTSPPLQIPAVYFTDERYAVMQYIPGEHIISWQLQHAARCRILDGLASFFVTLWTCPVPNSISKTNCPYYDWLTEQVDQAIVRAVSDPDIWGDPIHFLHRRRQARSLALDVPYTGVLMVRHGDLNPCNVIVEDGYLSGIVDWDDADWVPAPAAVQHPIFLADVPGWWGDESFRGDFLVEDRAYLESAIRKGLGPTSPIPGLLASSRERQFFELSLHHPSINEAYLQLRLSGECFSDAEASEELNSLLRGEVGLVEYPALQTFKERLQATTLP